MGVGDAPGLEVKRLDGETGKQVEEWIRVNPEGLAQAIVVNVGDGLQEMTNKEYISTTHRVVKYTDDLQGDRMSCPCFIHLADRCYLSEKYPHAGLYLSTRLV